MEKTDEDVSARRARAWAAELDEELAVQVKALQRALEGAQGAAWREAFMLEAELRDVTSEANSWKSSQRERMWRKPPDPKLETELRAKTLLKERAAAHRDEGALQGACDLLPVVAPQLPSSVDVVTSLTRWVRWYRAHEADTVLVVRSDGPGQLLARSVPESLLTHLEVVATQRHDQRGLVEAWKREGSRYRWLRGRESETSRSAAQDTIEACHQLTLTSPDGRSVNTAVGPHDLTNAQWEVFSTLTREGAGRTEAADAARRLA